MPREPQRESIHRLVGDRSRNQEWIGVRSYRPARGRKAERETGLARRVSDTPVRLAVWVGDVLRAFSARRGDSLQALRERF